MQGLELQHTPHTLLSISVSPHHSLSPSVPITTLPPDPSMPPLTPPVLESPCQNMDLYYLLVFLIPCLRQTQLGKRAVKYMTLTFLGKWNRIIVKAFRSLILMCIAIFTLIWLAILYTENKREVTIYI